MNNKNQDSKLEKQVESVFYKLQSETTKIMTVANFPDEVFPLLQMEHLITFEAMIHFRCDKLVEVGCYDGRALEIARRLNTRYLGIDLDQHAIQKLRTRIEREKMQDRAETIVGDVLNHTAQDLTTTGSRVLYLLPFNLLGNFHEPEQLLKQLAMPDVTAVISVFSDSAEATRVRQEYYIRCGVQGLDFHSQEDGVIFTGSDGFFSRSYSEAAFHLLLKKCGLRIIRTQTSMLGHCVTVQFHATEGSENKSEIRASWFDKLCKVFRIWRCNNE